jgi:glycosyltransferase involved in cell wall biosynthesis
MWIVVPAYNEAGRITATLDALAAQTDRDFTLLVVDNNSLDRTTDVVRAHPIGAHLIVEPHKGVGCAVDTGFRHAIAAARGALHANPGLIAGRIVARRDEHGPVGRAVFRVVVAVAAAFGRLRPANRGARYLAPYRMHAGNNMAITAALYEACGGMPRRPSPTDRAFLNRVRRTTAAITRCPAMVVENSTRRLRAYGLRGAARWYLDGGSNGLTPDPR